MYYYVTRIIYTSIRGTIFSSQNGSARQYTDLFSRTHAFDVKQYAYTQPDSSCTYNMCTRTRTIEIIMVKRCGDRGGGGEA